MFAKQPKIDPRERAHRDAARPRVLAVDDIDINIKVLKGFLEAYDCEVRHAYDGRKAVQMCRQQEFDLVIMDIQMQEMDGLEATRQIRAFEREHDLPAMPILAYTAHIKPADQHVCIAAGMNDYLPKPMNGAAFKEKVSIWAPRVAASERQKGSAA